ncbi:MAG: FtsW/RodA/SpoVE family cell cycle protein [Acidimicrobiales bacterium]
MRRTTELGLIILAALVTVGSYTLAGLGRTSSIPANIWPFLGIVIGLLVTAHLFTRWLAPRADGILLPLAALLNGIGYVFIARLDEAKAEPDGLALYQAAWTALGIAAFVLTLLVVRRARDLQRYRYTFMAIGLGLLLLPLVPFIGQEISGAQIWVRIGPVNFQPGEFAKIVLAIFFAAYLVERRELLGMAVWPRFRPMLPDPKHLGPVLVAWGVSMLVMIAQKDLGSSLLFFALFILLLWICTERGAYLAVGTVLFLGGSLVAWSQFAHVQDRVTTWLNPWPDGQNAGFQVIQSWFSLAWGGLSGTGIGLGDPNRIPVVETDFIFSAIGEELGLLGTASIITTFVLLVGAGLRIAVRTDGPFEKLLAAGLTVLIGVQAFIIMAGVTRLLPLTGVTLPFVSYGGSSLLSNYILLALLMRVSDDSARRLEQALAKQPPSQAAEAEGVAA